ncbi:hypothetical protein BASA81_012622 [Batrachochytrium salamandrivorans]|nr:hypothetical protein BASA81_012622 [Batrachochytrium salamandrivorans]
MVTSTSCMTAIWLPCCIAKRTERSRQSSTPNDWTFIRCWQVAPTNECALRTLKPLSPPPQEREECAKSVLETRAESWGLAIVPIQGDGSCMFRAISHQLFGVEDHHQLVRMLALKEVSANPDTYLAECTQTTA